MVVTGQQTQETLERWVFDVHTDKSIGPEGKVEKSQKEITSEIQAIIRQITASVTFLPLLDEPCTFDLLVYTDNDVDVPQVRRAYHRLAVAAGCSRNAFFHTHVSLTGLVRVRRHGRRVTPGTLRTRTRSSCAPSPPRSTEWMRASRTRRTREPTHR